VPYGLPLPVAAFEFEVGLELQQPPFGLVQLVPALVILGLGSIVEQQVVGQHNLVAVVEVACRKGLELELLACRMGLGRELLAFRIEVVEVDRIEVVGVGRIEVAEVDRSEVAGADRIEVVGVVRIEAVRTRVEGQEQKFVVVRTEAVGVDRIEVVQMIAVVRTEVVEVVRIGAVRTRVAVQAVSIQPVEGQPNYRHPIRKRFVRQPLK